ncbi:carbohydrate ABC transporter permease [Metabacillus halosaccharovorans]|uniref:Sugar ABC transporter permease n=1 Tax=Metabacillus halosaccharovorans TaxID=930124 RepID=A0ABT3DDJ7_9BACI|nr:sugar ABC transporter permease [Metabacillus halosaccharovorans]MCV9885138.1 sugar ABC transporter permease [Metabacillus halosaccharovorans]
MQIALKKLKEFRPIIFVLPALFFYILFFIIPLIKTIQFSFYRWDGASPIMEFIGLGNYSKMIHDPIFWKSLTHNLFWIVSTVVIPVSVGLILAALLSSQFVKGRLIFRVTFFMPVIVSLVAVGIIWNWIYHPDFGIINTFLKSIGLEFLSQPWLGSEHTVLPSLIVAGSWTYYGFCMVIFLAAIQGIDKSFYEAAKMEGANVFQSFFYVTVPLLKNVITLLVLNSLIGSFKVFDIIFLMTKGGPFHSSEVIGTYMFNQAFAMNDIGYGSAISIALALIIAICSISYIRFAEKND